MKKVLWGVITALIALNSASALTTSILQATHNSTGITPGKTGVITLSLTNNGADIAYDTKIALKAIDNPLTSNSLCNECETYSNAQKTCLAYADNCYTKVGDVLGSTGQEAIFRVNVPEDIESGVYVVEFDIHYQSKNLTTSATESRIINKRVALNINSLNVKPDVNIKKVTTPETISPGDEFNLTIELENTGDLKAQELNLMLLSDDLEVKGTTNNRAIGDLEVSDNKSVTYTLLADAALMPGVYTIGLVMNYTDNENSYSKNADTGILINGQADFNIFIQDISPDIITSDTEISAFISVANIGVINAQSVSIQINPCSDIELGNVNEDFLGDLDAGDFTSTSFEFKPKKEGEAEIKLTVKYTTPSGEKAEYNSTETIIFRFNKETTTTPIRGLNLTYIILGLAGIIITYFLIKRLTKKKKK